MSRWIFAGVSPEGRPFLVEGVDVWKYKWRTIRDEVATVTDPLYAKTFRFHVYEIQADGRTIRFAAGEFSNSVFGFYVSRTRVLKSGGFDDDRVKALLTRHLEGMHANSPPGHVFALDWSGLQKPEISFYTLWEGDELLGFGALKELDRRSGEIKSMRTADAHLRTGVAATILDHIIAEARRRGYSRLSLETGSGAAFEPALALYRKRGFTNGGPFGGYEASPFNQFLHLELIVPAS